MKLCESDIYQIRSIRNQHALNLGLKWIIGLLLILTVLALIRHFYPEFDIWYIGIWLMVILLIFISLMISINPYLKDERENKKLIEKHRVVKKEIEIRWTYTMNPLVDFQGHKPHLKLYKFITESETFYVEEGFYNNVSEGEEVELHKTLISKLHLTLTKSNLSQNTL